MLRTWEMARWIWPGRRAAMARVLWPGEDDSIVLFLARGRFGKRWPEDKPGQETWQGIDNGSCSY